MTYLTTENSESFDQIASKFSNSSIVSTTVNL